MMVSTLLSKMQFRTIPQKEEKGQAATKSVHPETRNPDTVEQGRDQSRMVGRLLTISIPDLVKVVDEVEATRKGEEREAVVAEEVAAASGLAKTSRCLRVVDPNLGRFSR